MQLNLSTTATLRTEESGCYYSYKTSEIYFSEININIRFSRFIYHIKHSKNKSAIASLKNCDG